MKTPARAYIVWILCLTVLAVSGCGPRVAEAPENTPEEPRVAPDPEPDRPPAFAWHTYHGDFSLSGAADTALRETPALAWRFMAGAPVLATPVAGDGRIYFANAKGRLFALDPHGNEVWSATIPREPRNQWSATEERFEAPLTFVDGLLLAGSLEGILFAIDAASGEVRWQTDLDGTILGAANVDRGASGAARVFVIEQGSGVLHAFDLRSGDPLWRAEGVDRCDGSPGVGGGAIVFGSCAAALHVFAADTGKRLHDIMLDGDSQVAGGVAVIGQTAFAGSRSGKLVKADTGTGAVVWTNTDCRGEAFSTPAVDRDWVVFGCADGAVHAVDRESGATRWTYAARGTVLSPVIARDKVVAAAEGVLLILSLEDGRELWSHEVGDEITSPAVFDGMVVVGSGDGAVAAFR